MSHANRVFEAFSASALVLFLCLSVVASNANPGQPVNQAGTTKISAGSNNFDQIVVVLMENKNLNEVYGPATYMTQLADQYAFSQHWASLTNPSQPNYIGLIGGSLFGVSGDGNHPNLNRPTIVDIIETSGHTWKAFAEDASGSACGLNPPRGEDHFPFLSYTTITGNAARCANLLPGKGAEVITEFNRGTNFIWLTPNDCNNMHDCSVSTGDNWIKSWVPNLLTAMAGKKAALILMFDEAYTSPPYIYMAFVGPATRLAYKSTVDYNHYSLIRLLEDAWGGGNLGQGDVTAASPLEFFGPGGPSVPDFSIAANPASVSFLPGQSATSMVSVQATGGFTGTVSLTTASSPAGLAASCSPSSVGGSQTSTCSLTSTTAGTYSVTVTGTSGSLVHTTSISAAVTTSPPGGGPPGGTHPGGRDPLLWPFSRDSIWNLPIGTSAVYVPANIRPTTQRGMTTDPDVIILAPNATMTAVYYNADGWSGGSRCAPQGAVLFNAPIPSNFVVPGATPTDTPNYATAILMPDGRTLTQGQPFARCTAAGSATMTWSVSNDLYGTGLSGGHGGSGLSSIGGTIRLGELVQGGTIRHALKVNLYALDNYYYDATTHGYRWPATQADGCASSCYGGTTRALRMGSLLAIPGALNIDSLALETEPAKILARAFQDYGAYAVDNTAWSVYAVETELGPQGRVEDEFSAAWGFPIDPTGKNVPWARDMDRIFGALNVVDNWDEAQWRVVSAANGSQGVGGGAPRAPWAPEFGTSTPGPSPWLPPPWVQLSVGPGIALASLVAAFAIRRRFSEDREPPRARERARPSVKSRPSNTTRRRIPKEEFEEDLVEL